VEGAEGPSGKDTMQFGGFTWIVEILMAQLMFVMREPRSVDKGGEYMGAYEKEKYRGKSCYCCVGGAVKPAKGDREMVRNGRS